MDTTAIHPPQETKKEQESFYGRVNCIAKGAAVYPVILILAILESLVLPIPLEVVLVPMLLKHRDKIWRVTTVAVLGSLIGAVIGYFLGMWFYESLAERWIGWMGWEQSYQDFEQTLQEDGFFPLVAMILGPIPFQMAQIAAGAAGYPLFLFLLASLLARGARFFGLALLVFWLGRSVKRLLVEYEKPLRWTATLATGAGLALWLVYQHYG